MYDISIDVCFQFSIFNRKYTSIENSLVNILLGVLSLQRIESLHFVDFGDVTFPVQNILPVFSVFSLSRHHYRCLVSILTTTDGQCSHSKTSCPSPHCHVSFPTVSLSSHCLVSTPTLSSVFSLYSMQNILPIFSVFSLPHIVSILTATNGHCSHCKTPRGLATMSRLLKIISLFCRISSLL